MSTVELEAQKAFLAREILTMNDENMIQRICLFIRGNNSASFQQKTQENRKLGILKGKANVVFHDDWSMTPEELGMV